MPTNQSIYELTQNDLDKVANNVDIPVCPAIINLVMTEAQKDEPDLKKLASVIAKDVGMAALTIKLANSPLFRTSKPAANVPTALAMLGIRNVMCVVVSVALRSSVQGLAADWLEKFWSHASLVATAAGLIAKKQYGIAPDAAYTYALFHDAAIPILMRRFENYSKVMEVAQQQGQTYTSAERQYFPSTHPVAGFLLAKNWGLPDIIGKAILFHHEDDVYDLPDKTLPGLAVGLIALTHVAERMPLELTESAHLEVSDVQYERALEYLGLSPDDLDEVREKLVEMEH